MGCQAYDYLSNSQYNHRSNMYTFEVEWTLFFDYRKRILRILSIQLRQKGYDWQN